MYEILIHDMDDGVDGNLTYFGRELPAPTDDVVKMVIDANIPKPYIARTYSFRLEGLNGRITGPQQIGDLNAFAERLSELSEYERVKLEGAALLTGCKTPEDCVKLMHNLDSFGLTPNVGSYEALGRYLAVNDFSESLAALPQDMMEHFDYDMLGRLGWDDSTNAFIKGHHIHDTEKELREPDLGTASPGYFMKMRLRSTQNQDGVWIKFPLSGTEPMDTPESGDELRVALASLKANSLDECGAFECAGKYPFLNRCLAAHADEPLADVIWKAQNLGYGEEELGQYGKDAYAKFAAALLYEDCRSLDFAADITQNLRCYDFAPDAETYAERYLADKGVDPMLTSCFDRKALGEALISLNNAEITGCGVISRNSHKFIFDYYQPPGQTEQQAKEIRLFCPLKIQTDPDSELGEEYGEIAGEYELADLPGYACASYDEEILAAIEKEHLPEEEGRGLAHYLHENTGLIGKVSYIWPSVEAFDNELYGVVDVKLTQDLSPAEFTELTEYITGQMSDGWGEGFEQRPVRTNEGDLYVSFWQSGDDYFLKPEQEFLQMLSGHNQTMQMNM